MTKRRALAFLLLFCMFALGFLLLAFDAFGKEPPPEIYRISVIVRGRAGDRWESIRQGADQAASEMNVDLSFITLSGENDSAEQISLLQREIDAGADAIVLSASDSAALAAPVEQAAEKAPSVLKRVFTAVLSPRIFRPTTMGWDYSSVRKSSPVETRANV